MPVDRCWVDGHQCSYGTPDGQYLLRPVVDCWQGDGEGTGCETYRRYVRNREIPPERRDEIVDDHFDANAIRTSEWFQKMAESFPLESPHRVAFQQLADEFGTGALKADGEVLLASQTPRERTKERK